MADIRRKNISIKEYHDEWVKKKDLNLSRFVQSKLDQHIVSDLEGKKFLDKFGIDIKDKDTDPQHID